MAMFRLDIKPVARGTGRSATSAAAYRAGEQIRDERTGALYNHSKRNDVLHKEIFLPSRLDQAGGGMEWARDRSTLWNAAEKAEMRSDSRVAREYLISLPPELSAEQRVALARAFSREIADRYKVAVDLAIHAPRPDGDPRNFHAHLLATTREVTAEGLGPKTGLDRNGGVRSELGLPTSRQEFANLRARWAELTNDALREANIDARVDHRSLEAQGIDREPQPHLPWAAIKAERRGERSELAERIRERHHERFAARREQRQQNAIRRSAENSAEATRADPARADAARHDAARPDVARPDAVRPDTARTDKSIPDMAREKPEPKRETVVEQGMDARRQQAVRDWLNHRASLEQAGRGQGGEGAAPPLSMDEIRRRAVEEWRSLRARGAESQPSAASRRERDGGRNRGEAEQARDSPGLGDDFPG